MLATYVNAIHHLNALPNESKMQLLTAAYKLSQSSDPGMRKDAEILLQVNPCYSCCTNSIVDKCDYKWQQLCVEINLSAMQLVCRLK